MEPLWRIEQVRGRGEAEIRRLATLQRGLVVRDQLVAAGIGRGAIQHRVAAGSLAVVHRGVYRVGHDAPAPFARELAAALCCPGFGVISRLSAGAVWGLWPHDEERDVQLTIVGHRAGDRRGIRVTRVTEFDPRDFRLHHGLPVTSPARTVVDLAATRGETLERALSEMRFKRLVSDSELWAVMDRCPRARGIARLRALITSEQQPGYTRSAAERRLRALLHRAELPRPSFNCRLHGYTVDALWWEARLVLEVDGFEGHGHRSAFERDRLRDQQLAAAGYTVIRVTWRQLVDQPMAVAVRIGQALAVAQLRRAA